MRVSDDSCLETIGAQLSSAIVRETGMFQTRWFVV